MCESFLWLYPCLPRMRVIFSFFFDFLTHPSVDHFMYLPLEGGGGEKKNWWKSTVGTFEYVFMCGVPTLVWTFSQLYVRCPHPGMKVSMHLFSCAMSPPWFEYQNWNILLKHLVNSVVSLAQLVSSSVALTAKLVLWCFKRICQETFKGILRWSKMCLAILYLSNIVSRKIQKC